MPQRPIITLTTDFGLNDHFVGAIKGVILGIARDAEIVDICHTVQAFDILDGRCRDVSIALGGVASTTLNWYSLKYW